MYTQAWSLRRMVSLFNQIVRRGHMPREPAIRRLMTSVGLEVQANTELDSENGELDEANDEDLSECLSEAAESEERTDDEMDCALSL